MVNKQNQIAWVYLTAAIFFAVSMYCVIAKDFYYLFGLPLVIGILLLYIFSLDKVILLISFLTPLSINIEDMDIGLGISLPVEPLLFGVLVLFIAKLLYERKYDLKIASHPISIVIYIMFLWMLVTTFSSEIPYVSIKYLISRLWFVIPSFFVGAIVFKKIKNIHLFIWLQIASLIIVVAYSNFNLARLGMSGNIPHWVMTPFYNDHTAYGAALAMFLFLSAGYLFYPRISKGMRTMIFIVFAILVAATVLSFSRAAWLSIVLSLGVFIVIYLQVKLRWIITIIASLALIFTVFQHEIVDALEKNQQDSSAHLVDHIKSITNISTDASNLERINRWQAAIRMYDERPILGWGPGTYQFIYAPFQRSKEKTIISTNAGDKGNAHSEYIGPLSEMGLPGMLIVFLLVGTMLFSGIKTYRRAKTKEVKIITISATLALLSFFLHGILNNFLDTDKLSIPVWGSMAVIVVMDCYFADKESLLKTTETIGALHEKPETPQV